MPEIKFSHKYLKMPKELEDFNTYLIQIFVIDYKELSESFIEYDTTYADSSSMAQYELPKTKLLVLLLLTSDHLWTTVRRWTPRKEQYYRGLIGQEIQINVTQT